MGDDRVPVEGVPVLITARPRAFGQVGGVVIERVRHAGLGIEWLVVQMLEEAEDSELAPGEAARYQVLAYGPLPGRPGESGYFTMTVRMYGDRAGGSPR
jgi:hypothetical protein